MTAASFTQSAVVPTDRAFRRRNAALLADLGKAIIEDPLILDGIPEGAMLVPLPADTDPEFIEASIAIGVDMIGKGPNVYVRHLAVGEWGVSYAAILNAGTDTLGDTIHP